MTFEKVGPGGPIEREWFDAAGNFHRLYQNGSESVITAELIADNKRWTVPEVLPLVEAYYAIPGNSQGGCLHIVLEDGNDEDHWLDACIETGKEWGDVEGERLARILRSMSRTQRKRLAREARR